VIRLADSLLAGLLICIPFTLFVVVTFSTIPRVWLHSLPSDIARMAGPKTPREERLTRWVMMPLFLAILPGLSILSAFWLARRGGIDLWFTGAFVHLYIVWVVVHAWDFAVIDCVYAALVDPARPPIAGTEGAAGWKDLSFHFRFLVKAVLMSASFVVPAAAVLAWVW
jgi:hypothetical protein